MSKSDYLTKRDGVWHYYRRVPSSYAHLDPRLHVKLSTKIKVANDRAGTKAGRVAARMNATNEAYWRSLADNKATKARQSYADAINLARSVGSVVAQIFSQNMSGTGLAFCSGASSIASSSSNYGH
jgi:hypothetical protein